MLSRTRLEYERALQAYRAVYHGDPGSPDAAPSVAAVADLLASEGRCFHDAKLLRDAVAQNEFLRREYPGSPLRARALLQEARIEQRDLRETRAAQKLYRAYLTRYPHGALAEEAHAALTPQSSRNSSRDLSSVRESAPAARTHSATTAQPRKLSVSQSPILAAEPVFPWEAAASTPRAATRPATPASTVPGQLAQSTAEVAESSSMSATAAPQPIFANTVEAVRYWTVGAATRLAVDLSGVSPYRAYLAPDGKRITIIVFDSRPARSLMTHAIDLQQDAYVRSIHASALTATQTEIAIDLHRPAVFSAFRLSNPERVLLDIHAAVPNAATASGGRLTVRLASPGEAGAVKQGGRERSERSHPAAGPPKSPAQMLAEPALAAEPIANGQRSMARVLGLRVRRIVLDAGHGGHDSGTLGPGGLEEKDIALDVALRLGRLLQQRLGADVVYTRRTDVFVPLEQRTAIANRAHADLFLSLHANASADPQARGVETYFLNFTASPSALAVAARENAVSNRSVYELSDLVRKITLSDKINESREFADDVQHSLYTGLAPGNAGLKDRGVKQAPFVVLIGANMPSILAEISFLTNPDDAAQLAEPAYRERLAEALYRGVARYVAGMSGIRVAKTAAPQVIAAPAE